MAAVVQRRGAERRRVHAAALAVGADVVRSHCGDEVAVARRPRPAVAVVGPRPRVVVAMRAIGLEIVVVVRLLVGSRYLPKFTFTAVLPLPKTSKARPPRGEMSL